MANVAAAALHQMAGKPAAYAFASGSVEVRRQVGELLVEQAQQRAERILVAAVGRRRDQQHVTRRVGRHAPQQIVPLLAAPAGAA